MVLCLDRYLQQQGFTKGIANIDLYIKVADGKLLIVFVYLDATIFGRN